LNDPSNGPLAIVISHQLENKAGRSNLNHKLNQKRHQLDYR